MKKAAATTSSGRHDDKRPYSSTATSSAVAVASASASVATSAKVPAAAAAVVPKKTSSLTATLARLQKQRTVVPASDTTKHLTALLSLKQKKQKQNKRKRNDAAVAASSSSTSSGSAAQQQQQAQKRRAVSSALSSTNNTTAAVVLAPAFRPFGSITLAKVLKTSNNNNVNNSKINNVFSGSQSLLEHAPTFRRKAIIPPRTSTTRTTSGKSSETAATDASLPINNTNKKKKRRRMHEKKNASMTQDATPKMTKLSSSSSSSSPSTSTENKAKAVQECWTTKADDDAAIAPSFASSNVTNSDDAQDDDTPMINTKTSSSSSSRRSNTTATTTTTTLNSRNSSTPSQPAAPLSLSLMLLRNNNNNKKNTQAPALRRRYSNIQNNNPSLHQSLFSSSSLAAPSTTTASSTTTRTIPAESLNGELVTSKFAVKNPYIRSQNSASSLMTTLTESSTASDDASDHCETLKTAATEPSRTQCHDYDGSSSSSSSVPAVEDGGTSATTTTATTAPPRRVSQSPMMPPPPPPLNFATRNGMMTATAADNNGRDDDDDSEEEEDDYDAMITDSYYLDDDEQDEQEEEEDDVILENHVPQQPPSEEQQQQEVAPNKRRSTAVPLSSLEPIPRLAAMGNGDAAGSTTTTTITTTTNKNKKKAAASGNFVRTNLRNGAGSCRGARNTKSLSKAALKFKERREQWKSSRQNNNYNDDDNDNGTASWTMRATSRGNNLNHASSLTGVDPVDDYVDGVFTSATVSAMNDETSGANTDAKKSSKTKAPAPKKQQRKQNQSSPLPLCSGHQRPCALRTVKKNTTGNKGRQFYCCAMQPRSEQCNHFQWADDTAQATERTLQQNQSHSGFVARQVAAYMERVKVLTVPELRDLVKRHDLRYTGKKQELLARMAIWVRDEIASTCREEKEIILNQQQEEDQKQPENEKVDAATTAPKVVATTVGQPLDMESGDISNPPPKAIKADGQDDETDSDECSSASSSEEELELFGTSAHRTTMKKQNEFSDDDSDDDDEVEESQDDGDDAMDESRLPPKAKNSKTSEAKRSSPEDPLLSSLFNLFGHESFREGQEWAIRRCLDKKRTLWVAPTGFGKSLCYALPAALTEGICIVVSPLLSLIQDQMRVLPPSIPAATLSGPLSTTKMVATLDDICRGRIKVVFVSPERLASAAFRRFFRQRWNSEQNMYERQFPTVSLLCVDEAHCLSQWAHNFRPCYLRMRGMVDLIAPDSILAITATAGPRVISDICKTLGINGTKINDQNERMDSLTEIPSPNGGGGGVRIMKTDRDNIDVSCLLLSTQQERLSKLVTLLSPVQKAKGKQVGKEKKEDSDNGCLSTGSVIVYVWRQRDAEAVAENIQQSGLVDGGVVIYHGGMDGGARTKAQSLFLRGKARICVATVAFGLGINKSDVSGVIHLYLAASPEHYLQEIGRAGRDGRPAKAVALILRDEVVVRHSLTHSDLISKSQTAALLRVLKTSIDDCFAVLPEDRSGTEPLSIGLSLQKAVVACGFKEETLETLVSLLEERNGKVPLMSVEGAIYDSASIAPMRRHLSQLATMEPIAKAILQSSVCFEAPAGEEIISPLAQESSSNSNKGRKLVGYSYGSYTFSVSQCANCLGPTAEPRHVYAALRRLQSCGELQLVLDTSHAGRGLNLRISGAGAAVLRQDVSKNDELIEELEGRLTSTIEAASRKVLDIDDILRDLSAAAAQCKSKAKDVNVDETKSRALVIFQQRMRDYFGQNGASDQVSVSAERNEDTIVPTNEFASAPPLKQLSNDVLSVIRHLLEMELAMAGVQQKQQQQQARNCCPSPAPLKLDDPSHLDYAALAVTKFLHGMAPVTAPYMACRQHMLFGSLQAVRFEELHASVLEALGPILCPRKQNPAIQDSR